MRLPGLIIFTAFALLGHLIAPSKVEHWVTVGGPLVIFGLLLACGLGLPLPEDVPLIIGGFLAAKHPEKMYLVKVAVLAWCGIIGGDCILYNLGKKYGLNVTRLPLVGSHLTKERILRAQKLFEKYGIWVVAVGRLFAGIRAGMVVAAGAIRFNFLKFVIADGVAALVSGGLFVGIGYLLGKKVDSIDDVVKIIRHYSDYIIPGIAVLAALLVAYVWWRSSRRKGTADAVVEKIEPAEPVGPKPVVD